MSRIAQVMSRKANVAAKAQAMSRAKFDKDYVARVVFEYPDCPTCRARKPGEMMPPHVASHRCESGGHNHCTCSVCF